MNFEQAFEKLVGHEGGYVNNPRDPGGETKYGVSKRSYPGEDIKGMTLERAREIYRRDYWGPAGCDAVPDGIKFDLFDMAVNSGIKPAVRTLQRAAGIKEAEVDGVLGPRTLAAVQAQLTVRLSARFNGARLAFMTDLTVWPAFSRGWAKRIAANLMDA